MYPKSCVLVNYPFGGGGELIVGGLLYTQLERCQSVRKISWGMTCEGRNIKMYISNPFRIIQG